jgi:hypothetical protein
MKPLAMSLDGFQNENNGYLVYIAPTTLILRRSLIHLISDFKYCKPLTSAIISSLEKRFPYIFDLSTSKSKDYIIRCTSNSKFKLDWVPVKYKELCTTLPSSTPVERLFSGAVQVYTARRNRFDNKTFEMLLYCTSND